MKTAVAVAVSVLLYGTGAVYAEDRTRSAIDVSTLSAQPGVTELGRLNNGMFIDRDNYGHVLSTPDLLAPNEQQRALTATEGASAIEISMFEEQPGVRADERAPLDSGMFSSRDSYGHILSDPDILERRAVPEREVTAEEASAIELSMFDVQPGAAERERLNNGMFNSRDSYGHILSDPDLFGE